MHFYFFNIYKREPRPKKKNYTATKWGFETPIQSASIKCYVESGQES